MPAHATGAGVAGVSLGSAVEERAVVAGVKAGPVDPVVAPAALIEPRSTGQAPSRLHGDAWLIARGGGSGDSLAFGQLGASQAGARLTYAVGSVRHVALSARVSTPLRGRGREGGVGLDWQPTRLPLHVLIEERLPFDGGRARPAAQLIAGGATRLPQALRAEGYAQAGAVARRGGFADGSIRVTHSLARHIDIGAGGWGAAQRRVARFDVGPTLGVTLPAQSASVRLTVDYRLRVAGRARPGSGPAVSLGTSF